MLQGINNLPSNQLNLQTMLREGLEVVDSSLSKRKDKIVLVLGTTGAGKSTLVNYLNKINLNSVRTAGGYNLEVLGNESSAHSIGTNNARSETSYPLLCNIKDKDYTFADCPGFGDSNGADVDIVNLFFRKLITKDVEEIKILLVCSFLDLIGNSGRGANFINSVKDLIKFLGAFEDSDVLQKLSKSIGIVVTQVTDNDATNIKNLKEKIADLVEDIADLAGDIAKGQNISGSKERKLNRKEEELSEAREELKIFEDEYTPPIDNIKQSLTNFISANFIEEENIKEVFDSVIGHNVTVFHRPNSRGSFVENEDRENIFSLIEKGVSFLPAKDADTRTIVSQIHEARVIEYIKEIETELYEGLSKKIIKGIDTYVARNLNKSLSPNEVKNIQSLLEKIKKVGSNLSNLTDFFAEIDDYILNEPDKEEFKKQNEKLSLFIGLLPQTRGTSNDSNLEATYLTKIPRLEIRLDKLQQDLDSIVKEESISFKSNTLSCTGHFIKLSVVKTYIQEDTGITPTNSFVVQINAFSTFILDDDFASDKISKLTVVAPNWVVTKTKVTVNISGVDQEFYPKGLQKAKIGENGLKGLPGPDGGDFVGVGKNFKDIERLEIKSNGGKGGDGQDGGDGQNGIIGSDADLSKLSDKEHDYRKMETVIRNNKVVGEYYFYYKEGNPGDRGGDAGSGGDAGDGGNGGSKVICNSKEKLNILLEQGINGDTGKIGSSGQVGKGGYYGKTAVKIYLKLNSHLDSFSIDPYNSMLISTRIIESSKRAEAGKVKVSLQEEEKQDARSTNITVKDTNQLVDIYNEVLFSSVDSLGIVKCKILGEDPSYFIEDIL